MQDSADCWSQVGGNGYLNAYMREYATPPEIMVQPGVLLPLMDYAEWNDDELAIMEKIKDGLPPFYSKELGNTMRWHPKVVNQMEAKEEQMKPMIMDSWYLNHPLPKLSRLAHRCGGIKSQKKRSIKN